MRRLLLVGVALAAFASPVAAQETRDLGRFLDHLTALWRSGDAVGLVEIGAGQGLDLEVRGDAMGPLAGRRAVAELRHLFNAQRTVAVRSGTPSRVIGTDDQAFVELIWEIRPEGTPVSESTIVFVGFVLEEAGWKVSQIRILP